MQSQFFKQSFPSPSKVKEFSQPYYLPIAGERIVRFIHFPRVLVLCGGARGVMVIVVGNGHGDTSSNPGRD